MALFTLQGVKYKDIIQYPDIEISEGSATFICGESGSGKSTLLQLFNGVISATDGKITYLGKDIESYEPIALRRDVLIVSQSVYLFDKSIRDNFNEYYDYRELNALDEETIKNYLDICSAHFDIDTMCSVLSGGERQRVFIAINLSYQSKVLMLDEPTSALDDKNANELMEKIKSYCKTKDITLIVVSHDMAIAGKYADNTIILAGGVK